MSAVDEWRRTCDPAVLPAIDALREAVKAADPHIEESIKWNAPSFAQNGQDRITLGIERKGGVRAVVHRGAAKVGDDFTFFDPHGLAQWPSPDRGTMKFGSAGEIAEKHETLVDFFARWLEATR